MDNFVGGIKNHNKWMIFSGAQSTLKKCPHVYFKGPDMEGRWETEENVVKKARIFLDPQGGRFLKPARP